MTIASSSVSYTHLDVYKRQYQYIVKMFYVGWRGGYPSKKDLLSSTYLRGVYVAFNMIFKQGVKQGYCSRSPMDEVLKPEVDTKERHSLKQHEVRCV